MYEVFNFSVKRQIIFLNPGNQEMVKIFYQMMKNIHKKSIMT